MRRLLVALVIVAASGCSIGGPDKSNDEVGLEPQFAPLETTIPPPTTVVAAGGTTVPIGSGGATTTARPAGGAPSTTTSTIAPAGTAAIPTTTGSFTDRRGDVTVSVDRPPAWADLVGATLTRSASGFELRIGLGGDVPATYEQDRTINIASFFDVTGDGVIDYEVWANLASGGWGGSYFDNTQRGANRLNDDALTFEPRGSELVVRFPLGHLAGVERFRWSIASEWGRYEVIGTAAAARDDAPDNDAPSSFPAA